jgi:hypothetical protein
MKNIILVIYSLLTLILLVGMSLSESRLIGHSMASISMLGIIGILIYSFRKRIEEECKKILRNPLYLSFFMIIWGAIMIIVSILNYNTYPNAHNDFIILILSGLCLSSCGILMMGVIIDPQKNS